MAIDLNYVWLIFVAVVALAVAAFLFRRSKSEPQDSKEVPVISRSPVRPQPVPKKSIEAYAHEIVIGKSSNAPMLTIRNISSESEFGPLSPMDTYSKGTISRLSPLLQSVPSLLVAKTAASSRLMHVVVNGRLVSAADGNGMRAFVMGPAGIKEQARLLDASRVQNLISAAAIWQVASVLVAQKHLADISLKLKEIENSVAGISRFLDNQRKARITAVHSYLRQIYTSLQVGEFSEAVRRELESCERDLIEIQDHLLAEYRQKTDSKIAIREWGTEKRFKGIESKINGLTLLAHDIAACLELRIAAWHVLSIFPGNYRLSSARRKDIEEAILAFARLGPHMRKTVLLENVSLLSFWNKDTTIASRRNALEYKRKIAVQALSDLSKRGWNQIKMSERTMREAEHPTHLLLQVENGAIKRAWQRG